MPQPTPKPAAKPAGPPTDTVSSGSDAAAPQPAEEGAIFLALLDAGADARVAYTAEKRLHTMISDAIAPQFESFLTEMTRRFDEHDRRFDDQDRQLDALATAGAERDRKLDTLAKAGAKRDRKLDALTTAVAEHDRTLAVLAAQMRLVIGALGLLVTVLIAVFGFLFANAN